MKVIKGLTVEVTYRVSLGNVEVSDEVYNALSQCYDDGGDVSPLGMTGEEAVSLLEQIIESKKAIGADYSGDSTFLEQIKKMKL